MTPERKKWWDSLSVNEKELRESLKIHRNLLSFNKMELTNNKDSAYISKLVRRQKVLIKAIKHELERKDKVDPWYCPLVWWRNKGGKSNESI